MVWMDGGDLRRYPTDRHLEHCPAAARFDACRADVLGTALGSSGRYRSLVRRPDAGLVGLVHPPSGQAHPKRNLGLRATTGQQAAKEAVDLRQHHLSWY